MATDKVLETVVESGCVNLRVAIIHDKKIPAAEYEVKVHITNKIVAPKSVKSTFAGDARKYAEFKVRQTRNSITTSVSSTNGLSNQLGFTAHLDRDVVFQFNECKSDEESPPEASGELIESQTE